MDEDAPRKKKSLWKWKVRDVGNYLGNLEVGTVVSIFGFSWTAYALSYLILNRPSRAEDPLDQTIEEE